jgi:hypothetical protein
MMKNEIKTVLLKPLILIASIILFVILKTNKKKKIVRNK